MFKYLVVKENLDKLSLGVEDILILCIIMTSDKTRDRDTEMF